MAECPPTSQENGVSLQPKFTLPFLSGELWLWEVAPAAGEGAQYPCRSQGSAGLRDRGGRCFGLILASPLGDHGLSTCVPVGGVALHAPHSLATPSQPC